MEQARLPSFVELMASLGLQNDAEYPNGPSPVDRLSPQPSPFALSHSHSRSPSLSSSSTSSSPRQAFLDSGPVTPSSAELYQHHSEHRFNRSPSIVISEHEPSPTFKGMEPEIRRGSIARNRLARYSPYGAQLSHARRVSMPSLKSDKDFDPPSRALSSSPESDETSRRPRRLDIGGISPHRSDSKRGAPAISTFVRRRTPTASPTSMSFPHRRKPSCDMPPLPVSIPTVPPLFSSSAPHSPKLKHFTFPPPPTGSDTGSGSTTGSPFALSDPPLSTSHRSNPHAGVRISAPFRVERDTHSPVSPVS